MSTDKLDLKSDDSCFIIGEVGQTHDGSLGLAHAFIDAIADAGADAVKFQTHIAAAESSPDEPWRVKFSPQDETRYDYWQRMEFSEDHWHGLKKHANERGLAFMSTPFSFEALELLERVGVPVWKVGSGETNNTPMLSRMTETGIPILLSTGMSTIEEIEASVSLIREAGIPVGVMQCTTAYPCPPERVGLNNIAEYRERFGGPVGLSDHSGTIFPGLAAAALGIQVLEVHVTLTRSLFGPDVPASVTTDELKVLCDGVRFIETMRANPTDKDAMAAEMGELRDTFTKSLVSVVEISAGTVLAPEHLTVKKPGTGIPAARLNDIIGRRTARTVLANVMLSESDLE